MFSDSHYRDRFFMGPDLEDAFLGFRQNPRVSCLENVLLWCHYPNKLYPFPTVDIDTDDILIISEEMLGCLNVRVLCRDGKGFNSLCLSFVVLSKLPLDNIIICGQGKDMFFEVSEYHSFNSVVFFNRQFGTVVELTVDALTPTDSLRRSAGLEQTTWGSMQNFFRIPGCLDGLQSIEVLPLLFFQLEKHDVTLFVLPGNDFPHLWQLSLNAP